MSFHEKVLGCYLDTSIFNFVLEDERKFEKTVTQDFLERCRAGEYHAHISELVLVEINRTGNTQRLEQLLGWVNRISPILLAADPKVNMLVDRYMEEKIIPVRYRDDAVHIAVAVVYDLDVLVSWNQEHMVKLKTRRSVNAINQLFGYKMIEIATPAEVL